MMLYTSIAFLLLFLPARFREAAGRFVLRPMLRGFVLRRPSLTRTWRRTHRFAIARSGALHGRDRAPAAPKGLAWPCQSERAPPTCGGAAEPPAAGMGADWARAAQLAEPERAAHSAAAALVLGRVRELPYRNGTYSTVPLF